MNDKTTITRAAVRRIKSFMREIYNKRIAMNLNNQSFSLITNNCMGGFMLHDLGLQFNSPFVNLWIKPMDFIKYLSDFEHYIYSDLVFIPSEFEYPVALLDDITIYFAHYKSKEEAKQKWEERTVRINFDNLFVVLLESNDCRYEDLEAFDKIPIKNKKCFTYQLYPKIKSSVYIEGFESVKDVGTASYYKNYFTIKKNYDDFNYIDWFNSI